MIDKSMENAVYKLITVSCLLGASLVHAEEAVQLERMDVVGVTPLQGSGVDIDKMAAPVQTFNAQDLQNSQSLSLADYMNRYLGSVHFNEAQNNPLQPDVYYRGFVASPLMGLPQGLSIYVNGVRFNEPFGDTVNWDLIPSGAVDSMTLAPGSNPLFGLNTLGGAISVKTKTGFSFNKHQLEVSGGSWDRHQEELTSGWNNGTWGYFIDLNHFEEEGWRDFSDSKADRVFGTLSWRGDRGELDLTLAATDNILKGNGAVPEQLHNLHRKAIFTHPDQTVNRMFFSELSGIYDLTDDIQLSGNAYFRQNRMRSFNGDDSDYEECSLPGNAGLLCEDPGADEEVVEDVNGDDVTADDAVEGATNNISQTYMRSAGGNLQTLFTHALWGHENHFVFGAFYDYSDVHYQADTELGSLTDSRGTTHSGVFIDEGRVRLNTTTETYSFYFSDYFSITDSLTLSFSGRYNHVSITLDNQRRNPLGGVDKLSGHHNFDRFNPAVGLTWRALDELTVYGGYSESSRVPTPMELSCADEDDPCRLPNAFLADPPLAQVVAKTWEAGVRGRLADLYHDGRLNWNVGFFHTTNHNDIIFNRGGDSLSEGFFSNVGQTQRYGVETGLDMEMPHLFSNIDDWRFSTHYTYLNATFRDGFRVQHPDDENLGVNVQSGDRIPGLPEHVYKASLGVTLWRHFSLDIDALYNGEQYFRGDEANIKDRLGGYWLFNARAEYRFNEHVALFGRIDNIFDRDYKSFGVYGESEEVLGSAYDNDAGRRFVSPGAPRAGWIGIRLSL